MNNNKDKYKEILRNLINTVLILGIIIALAFGGYLFYKNQKEKNGDDTKLSYTDLVKEIEAGRKNRNDNWKCNSKSKIKRCRRRKNNNHIKHTSIYRINSRKDIRGKRSKFRGKKTKYNITTSILCNVYFANSNNACTIYHDI